MSNEMPEKNPNLPLEVKYKLYKIAEQAVEAMNSAHVGSDILYQKALQKFEKFIGSPKFPEYAREVARKVVDQNLDPDETLKELRNALDDKYSARLNVERSHQLFDSKGPISDVSKDLREEDDSQSLMIAKKIVASRAVDNLKQQIKKNKWADDGFNSFFGKLADAIEDTTKSGFSYNAYEDYQTFHNSNYNIVSELYDRYGTNSSSGSKNALMTFVLANAIADTLLITQYHPQGIDIAGAALIGFIYVVGLTLVDYIGSAKFRDESISESIGRMLLAPGRGMGMITDIDIPLFMNVTPASDEEMESYVKGKEEAIRAAMNELSPPAFTVSALKQVFAEMQKNESEVSLEKLMEAANDDQPEHTDNEELWEEMKKRSERLNSPK